ncbi:hypothetical protein PHMEG_00031885, partial [Phytophthora megakarya]
IQGFTTPEIATFRNMGYVVTKRMFIAEQCKNALHEAKPQVFQPIFGVVYTRTMNTDQLQVNLVDLKMACVLMMKCLS